MCTIDGLYSNSAYRNEPLGKWVWLKEAALNFAIALIVGSLSAAICYALKGSDLDLFYKIGGAAALGIFLLLNVITVLKKENQTPEETSDIDLEDIVRYEEPYSWKGKQTGEILPHLFVGNHSKSITYDYEIRLRVLRSTDSFPKKTEMQNKWNLQSKIIYYDVALKSPKGLFKLQARKLADFVEQIRENGKKVLFTGIYNTNNEKISLEPLQKESPFVNVGIMVAHYLMQKTECTREEVLSFLARELNTSYADKTRIYNGQKGLTLSTSVHIDNFCPEMADDFLEDIDVSTIASKWYRKNQEGFNKMKANLQELLDLEDEGVSKNILQNALKELEGSFDLNKMNHAKSILKTLPD